MAIYPTSSAYISNVYNNYGVTQSKNNASALAAITAISGKTGSNSSLQNLFATASTASANFILQMKSDGNSIKQVLDQLSASKSATQQVFKSSNTTAATVTGASSKAATPYTIDVNKIATAQQNTSNALASNGRAELAQGSSLTIQVGDKKVNVNLNAATTDQTPKTNSEMLKEVASAINSSNSGVTAKVVEKDGVSSITMESNSTGEAASFTATGSAAQSLGLNNQTQAAGNASYSITSNVDGQTTTKAFTSATNTIKGTGGETITLNNQGSTEVSTAQGVDTKAMAANMQKLVDALNKANSTATQNSSRGTGAARIADQFGRGFGAKSVLEGLGITQDSKGVLKFNEAKFQKAIETNSQEAMQAIDRVGQSAKSFATTIQNQSPISLINKDVAAERKTAVQNLTNSENAGIANYAKSGLTNMMNYYSVGALVNMQA